jgi:hypothetical protein
VALRGDTVVRQGALGDEMYIIHKGEAEAMDIHTGEVYEKLHAGKFFGEIALFSKVSGPSTARGYACLEAARTFALAYARVCLAAKQSAGQDRQELTVACADDVRRLQVKRTVSVRASTYMELLVIPKAAVMRLLDVFPKEREASPARTRLCGARSVPLTAVGCIGAQKLERVAQARVKNILQTARTLSSQPKAQTMGGTAPAHPLPRASSAAASPDRGWAADEGPGSEGPSTPRPWGQEAVVAFLAENDISHLLQIFQPEELGVCARVPARLVVCADTH